MLLAPVQMPDPYEGDRPIDLRPTLSIWLALEKAHGGSLGALFIDTKLGRVSLAVQLDLIFRCAREGGSSLSFGEISLRVHRLGLYRTTDLVLELFSDVFVTQPAEPDPQGEGGAGVPLASGA